MLIGPGGVLVAAGHAQTQIGIASGDLVACLVKKVGPDSQWSAVPYRNSRRYGVHLPLCVRVEPDRQGGTEPTIVMTFAVTQRN